MIRGDQACCFLPAIITQTMPTAMSINNWTNLGPKRESGILVVVAREF